MHMGHKIVKNIIGKDVNSKNDIYDDMNLPRKGLQMPSREMAQPKFDEGDKIKWKNNQYTEYGIIKKVMFFPKGWHYKLSLNDGNEIVVPEGQIKKQ